MTELSATSNGAGGALSRLRDRTRREPIRTPEEELIARELTDEDVRRLTSRYDDRVPLPKGAAAFLSPDNPRLLELQRAYAGLHLPATGHSQWNPGNVGEFLDLRYFRGDTMLQWHYRELPRATRLKLFIYFRYVQSRDDRGLFELLGEDGAFGCWTYDFPGCPLISRDLLESMNELLFLQRELSLLDRRGLRVLDIGAGYGRLAHRMAVAAPHLADYCCVDAIAESSFLCEYYLRFRGCSPPARSLPLHLIDTLEPGQFDVAVNVHSFSECTLAAVEWWAARLREWRVPILFVIPNEPNGMLSIEPDGSRRDLLPVLAGAGYRPVVNLPAIEDRATREMTRIHDRFHLFELSL